MNLKAVCLISLSMVILACPVSASIHVHCGQTFAITLESNPTTGYSWSWVKLPSSSGIKLVKSSYQQNDNPKGMVGVGGHETFIFKASKKGETTLKFNYARPWEKNTLPVQKQNIEVWIR